MKYTAKKWYNKYAKINHIIETFVIFKEVFYMKRKILSTLLAIILLFSLVPLNVFANQNVTVYLDNQLLQFDVSPQIINDRTMVPMRVIFEKLGAEVSWDGDTNTAHAYDYDEMKGVSITIGAPHMVDIHNNIIPLDSPAIIQDERTLVPIRAISEAFGCDVQWDGSTNTVKIFSEDFIDFSDSTGVQEEVRISTAEEFLNSIGSNKKIILTSDYYNLSSVNNINNSHVEKQVSWDGTYFDAYIFKNVVNMTIEGNAEIVIDDIDADVLSFQKCGQITLSGLTIGHSTKYEQYQCEGAVTDFVTCDSIYINNCNLYGCGAFGVYANNTTNLNVTNSKIYDCTYTGIWLARKSSANVNKTDFFDSVHSSGFLRIDNSNITCTDCNIYNITCDSSYGSGMFIDTFDSAEAPSDITLTDCTFKDNQFANITNDGNQKITFNNCSFQDNVGNMNHTSVIYNNSTISTPQ